MLKLGIRYQCVTTGVSGIATGYCTYITGCDRYLIQPKSLDGVTMIQPEWIDVGVLVELPEGPTIDLERIANRGAGMEAPKK